MGERIVRKAAMGHDSPPGTIVLVVGLAPGSGPWGKTLAVLSAFPGNYGRGAPAIEEEGSCQERPLRLRPFGPQVPSSNLKQI